MNKNDQKVAIQYLKNVTVNIVSDIDCPIIRWCPKCKALLYEADYIANSCDRCNTIINYQSLLFSKKKTQLKLNVVYNNNKDNFQAQTSDKYGFQLLNKISSQKYNTINDFEVKWFKMNNEDQKNYISELSNIKVTIDAKVSIYNTNRRYTMIEIEEIQAKSQNNQNTNISITNANKAVNNENTNDV